MPELVRIRPDRLEKLIARDEDLEDTLAVAGHKHGFDPNELRWEPAKTRATG